MPRLTKIYTRKGDDGTTALGGGQRVSKDSLRVAGYGAVDEFNSQIGLALANGLSDELAEALSIIQNELFHLGSDLCFEEKDKIKHQIPQIEQRHVNKLEELIDRYNEEVGPLENFILPGGTSGAAYLHVARTGCRRVEREVTALAHTEPIGAYVVAYLNRLSDLLFVMARYENKTAGVPEPVWNSRL